MHEEKRGTGRTTRMCRYALDLLRQGRAVYIYTRADQIDAIHRILQSLMREHNRAVGYLMRYDRGKAVLTGPASNSHAFVAVEVLDPHYDFQQGKVPGMHPNCVCLVDHCRLESLPLFQALMRHWEQFDGPQPPSADLSAPFRPQPPPASEDDDDFHKLRNQARWDEYHQGMWR